MGMGMTPASENVDYKEIGLSTRPVGQRGLSSLVDKLASLQKTLSWDSNEIPGDFIPRERLPCQHFLLHCNLHSPLNSSPCPWRLYWVQVILDSSTGINSYTGDRIHDYPITGKTACVREELGEG